MKLNFILNRLALLWILSISQLFTYQARFASHFFTNGANSEHIDFFEYKKAKPSGECWASTTDFCKMIQVIRFEEESDVFDLLELKEFLFFDSSFFLKKLQKASSVQNLSSNQHINEGQSQYLLNIIWKQTLF